MEPRVPETQAARALLWALLAAAAFGASAAPRDPGRLAWQRDTRECRLAPLRPGAAPCPCSAVPLALRETLGLAAPLNALGARELERVPGIGPVRAAAIERERARGGAFAEVDELTRRVPGLGPKTVDRIRSRLFVTGPDPACGGSRGE
ncbi:MAG TPA: helix-hairpin-helix domain-containing protein [Myxococcota bacterium]|nr:helix-hairpin-helix domain-containing protein [Myxococcota bacterium]